MTVGTLVFVLGLVGAQVRAADPPNDLAAVRALYTSARYEDALTRLAAMQSTDDIELMDQYRALCLLALGRTSEAQQTLERIIIRNPMYVVTDAQVSPRLVTLLRDVRRRALPAAAKELYARAKASFDQKKYPDALSQLQQLRKLLADDDLAGQPEVADLKKLADGFAELTHVWMAAESKSNTGPTPARGSASDDPGDGVYSVFLQMEAAQRANGSRVTANAERGSPVVYSVLDSDVTAPTDINRPIPAWNPPTRADRELGRRGLVEVVIDEHGRVESAFIRQSISLSYDAQLLQAAKQWRFRPASRDGIAVKYRKFIEITFPPRDQSPRADRF